MKRAVLIGVGTVAGAAAILGYHPGTWFATSAQATSQAPPDSKTYKGDAVDTGFGPIQATVTVLGTEITSITAVQQSTDGKSQQISSFALPQLQQAAVTAQSASVDGVSGASYTSDGFKQSLQSALTQITTPTGKATS